MKSTTLAASLMLILGGAGVLHAAPRTVCLDLRFKDNRSSANCALTSETGNFRGCSPGSDVHHQGAVLELWDKDSDGTDERIGSFLYGSTDTTCWSFEWDNNATANAEHEANPDVYPVYVNQVNNVANTRAVVVKKSDGSAQQTVTWRNGETGSPDVYTAVDCVAGVSCMIDAGGYLLPSGDPNTDVSKRAMVLDSAQHTLDQFGGIMTSNVNIRFPDTTGTCLTACTTSRTNIQYPDAFASDGIRVTHELGHAIQMQIFGQDTLRDDTSKNGSSGWTLTSDEFDSAASQEGVATYAGLAAWYDGGVANTNPSVWGFNFETATPNNATCSLNRGVALQVAKAFWDLDDITNEAAASPATGADGDGFFPGFIMQEYSTFPGGSGNRQKNESDSNGVNVRDYIANTNLSAVQPTTMLSHNCLSSQDDF